MSIHLNISADSVEEFDALLAHFAKPNKPRTYIAETATVESPAAEPAPKGNARSRKTKEAGDGAAEATSAAPSTAETTATPAATSPVDQAVAEAGEVTIQQLKDAMADLLKAKSASFAMQTLEQATGCKSLTSGSPNVVEKAKDDPSIMRRTLGALVAAKNAA